MSRYIALIRGVNVGGNKMLAMSALRDMMMKLGFTGVKTLLQSGNVVFDSTAASIERMLEAETGKRLGVSADFVIRSSDEWEQIIARNPFAREAKRDPSHTLVMFFKSEPDETDVESVREAIAGDEKIHLAGKQMYMVYPSGIGRSKLTGALIEKKLSSRGTARNWNTITKLSALIRADEASPGTKS